MAPGRRGIFRASSASRKELLLQTVSTLLWVAQAQGENGGGLGGNFFLFLAIVIFAFYFLIIRPQRKEAREREVALNQVKKGSKVITAGGIHGRVTNASAKDTVELEIAKNTRITINRSSISVMDADEKDKKEKEDKDGGATKDAAEEKKDEKKDQMKKK